MSESTSCRQDAKKRKGYEFHPFELAFTGFSGAGKTTLLSKLLKRLGSKYSIAFIKRDAHRFHMDKEGKDTYVAWESGAQAVKISDRTHSAYLTRHTPDGITASLPLLDHDFALVEGYKTSTLPKVLVLDKDEALPESLPEEALATAVAVVGPNTTFETPLPYFHRDDEEGIAAFVETYFLEKAKGNPLKGLLVAGGYSTRMKQDKALLHFKGKTLLEQGMSRLSEVCETVTLSAREGQYEREAQAFTVLPDRFLNFGPLGGILTAMTAFPEAAWLVTGVDLPLLDKETLTQLIEERDPFAMATTYLSEVNGFPEPLCTLYEPKIRVRLHEFMARGYQCPRKVLINTRVKALKLSNPHALKNINTPEDYDAIHHN